MRDEEMAELVEEAAGIARRLLLFKPDQMGGRHVIDFGLSLGSLGDWHMRAVQAVRDLRRERAAETLARLR